MRLMVWLTAAVLISSSCVSAAAPAPEEFSVFRLGTPDGSAMEFGLSDVGWGEYRSRYAVDRAYWNLFVWPPKGTTP